VTPLLDTSVIVRYLTGDPPELLSAAREIVDGSETLLLTDVMVVETAYVLTSVYRVPRERVVDSLVDLLQKKNLAVFGLEKGIVIEGLLLCRTSGRVSFADALLWTVARTVAGTGADRVPVYTFDGRFPSEGVELRDSL
jgi:predicted nucleic acid-binding protein